MKKAENSKLELFFEKLRLFGSQFFPAIFRFLKSKLALKILLTLIIGTVALVTYFWFACCQDELPPDDTMFMQKVPKIPNEENAFELLSKAGEAIKWPEDDKERKKAWDIARGNVEWDQTFVDKILEDNKEALKLYDEGMKKPKLQCPFPHMPSLSFLMPWIPNWNIFASLNSIRILNHFHSGNSKKALREACKLFRFGQMVQGDGGGVIDYLVGLNAKSTGLKALRNILPKLTQSTSDLKKIIEVLPKYRVDEKVLNEVINLEYRVAVHVIANELVGDCEETYLEKKTSLDYLLYKFGYSYKPNKTKRYYATTYKCYVRNIPLYFDQMDFKEEEDLEKEIFDADRRATNCLGWDSGPDFKNENRLGIVCYAMTMYPKRSILQKKCTVNVEVEATRVLIALKCFKDEKGKLPETLDELVPEYLDKVPIDDFDGKPLKYSKKEKRVYSSGKRRNGDKEEPLSFDIEF